MKINGIEIEISLDELVEYQHKVLEPIADLPLPLEWLIIGSAAKFLLDTLCDVVKENTGGADAREGLIEQFVTILKQ